MVLWCLLYLWLPPIYCSPFPRVGRPSTLVGASGTLDLAAPLPGILSSSGATPGSGPTTAPLPDHSPAWLAELLGVAPTLSTPPLVLASALPPIPGKAVEKILKGQFMDFKELLMDNVALMSQLQELGAGAASAVGSRSHLRDVSDPVTWVYCFLSFVAVLCPDSRTRELLAYGQIIIQLARSHRGTGWLVYDRRFCQQVAAGTPLSWAKINPSFLTATVLGSAPAPSGRNCQLCLSWDHGRADCALASLAPQSTKGRRAPVRQRPYSLPGEYCCRFNACSCPNTSESCRFLHACSSGAKAGHPASDCKEAKGKSKAPVA